MLLQRDKLVRERLDKARDSLEDAMVLLIQDAEVNFVLNSIYYALMHVAVGLLQHLGISAPDQNTAIALFEDEWVLNRGLDPRFAQALRQANELRPTCACKNKRKATHEDAEALLPIAEEFLLESRRILSRSGGHTEQSSTTT